MPDYRTGWIKDYVDGRDFRYSAVRKIATDVIPGTLDLSPFMPAVEDQGHFSSCVGNAVTSALEALQKKHGSLSEKDLSRMFVYWFARFMDGLQKEDGGCMIRSAIKSVAALGCCLERNWKYTQPHLFQKPGLLARCLAKKRLLKDYYRVDYHGPDDLRAAMAEGFPIVFGTMIFESFARVRGDGIVPMPDVSKEIRLGGHAMVMCGYDPTGWRVQNSWGKDWGLLGYCHLPLDYFETVSDFGWDFWVLRQEAQP